MQHDTKHPRGLKNALLLSVLLVLLIRPVVVSANTQALSAAEMEAAAKLGETISTSEWLGPLAPIAISPFFGMACLAGLAQYSPDSMIAGNGFLSADSPLHNPAVFWTFMVLALLTSLPRLTKVSKPIAGALEQLESYSSIIALVTIRYMAGNTEDASLGDEVVYAAGIGSITSDALLSIAAACNIIVVNAVKFFFEFLIWLTPIPTIDACFEAISKVVAGGLMALYAWSPTAATAVNLIIFVACAIVFLWVRRQVVFMRTLLVGWLMSWFVRGKPPTDPELIVFPKDDVGPFSARERVFLTREADGSLRLSKRRWLGGETTHSLTRGHGRIEPGWIANAIVCDDEVRLLLSRGVDRHLDVVAALMHLELVEPSEPPAHRGAGDEIGRAKPAVT